MVVLPSPPPGIHHIDMKPVPVNVFEAVRQAGEAEGDQGRPGLERSFDQLDLSANGFYDRAFFSREIVRLTDHGVTSETVKIPHCRLNLLISEAIVK